MTTGRKPLSQSLRDIVIVATLPLYVLLVIIPRTIYDIYRLVRYGEEPPIFNAVPDPEDSAFLDDEQ